MNGVVPYSANGRTKESKTVRVFGRTGKRLLSLMRIKLSVEIADLKESLSVSLLPRYLYCLANSNVWGHTHAEELETLHCKFCKFTRGVPKTTTNLACYGELGKNPIAKKASCSK